MWGQRLCNSLKDNSLEGCFWNLGSEVEVVVKGRQFPGLRFEL